MKEFLPTELTERLSHEWRTPLQGILGAAELLESGDGEGQLETLRNCTHTLAARLDYFLVLIDLEKNTFHVSPQWMRLSEVARAFTTRAEQRLRIEPETTDFPHALVQIDLMRTLQLIDFLGGQISEEVEFAIKMQADVSEKQQFYWQIQCKAGPTPLDRFGRRALEALCQRLSVRVIEQSNENAFFLQQRLPLQAAEAKPAPAQQTHNPVLIVDDNATNRRVTSALLESLGMTTLTTDQPETVAELLQKQQVALVLMDIQMPQKDGRTLTEELRKRFGDELPPIVAFTALNLPEEQNRWLETGLMDDLLTKPASRQRLKQILKRWGLDMEAEEQKTKDTTALPEFIDSEVWKQLARYGGEEMIRESLREFAEETREHLKCAWLAVQKQQWEELRKITHTLKGSAGTLGIQEIAQTAASMEHNLRLYGSYSDVFTDFITLQHAYHQFDQWFVQFSQMT